MRAHINCACTFVWLFTAHAESAVVEFQQKPAWQAAAGSFTTIPFTGYPDNTVITTQYAALGVVFTDGTDRITLLNNAFPNDGAGLRGVFNEINLSFAQPMHHIAVDFPGGVRFSLYWQGQLTYTSSDFLIGGAGHFAGLISDEPFDAAIIVDPSGGVNIDDLHFGAPIPAPGVLAVFALAPVICRKRRA